MFEVVLASRNREKKRELKALLDGLKIRVSDLNDFPSAPKVKEDGRTFEENAAKKALPVAKFTKKLVLADDSGLEVRALGGKPGVRSARFAGGGATYADNNRKLLKLLEGVPENERGAKFVCAIAVADAHGIVGSARGECGGRIAFVPKGRHGFGYDPLFLDPRRKKTFAELPPKVKNRISHRSKALKKARAIIRGYFRRNPLAGR